MIYETKVGITGKMIAGDSLEKGDLFSLKSVNLKETESGGGEDPIVKRTEIDEWVLGEYKSEEGVVPFGVILEDVEKDAEVKYVILFRPPEFAVIRKL